MMVEPIFVNLYLVKPLSLLKVLSVESIERLTGLQTRPVMVRVLLTVQLCPHFMRRYSYQANDA